MSRPLDLPEFLNPPLIEVVLGIQFAPAIGYQQIRAGEVWALFRSDFPNVQELPPLSPTFETFGLPQTFETNVGLSSGASHNRFWFVSPDGDELIQFQNDRLLHNWRKAIDQSNRYPRFESIIADFQSEAERLEGFFANLYAQKLSIQQCEISYINHIRAAGRETIRPSEWLTFFKAPGDDPDDFSCTFRRIIRDENGQPRGRLTCESATIADATGKKAIALGLTARGAPDRPDLNGALDFLSRGREMIVRLFADVTTDSAHQAWERLL